MVKCLVKTGLRVKKRKWKWLSKEDKEFRELKKTTKTAHILKIDPKLPLPLACDASAYGIGAVLAHKMPDGTTPS